eukprot:TRINITY_DN1332_c0_g1_i2.p1 TRINITY_DN1332_c0_g1~~TRINITY_DN1332_c0_g1_i2.p1  ORF type:complete len:446 (+),score=119.60 TRINITY_DN1332_c0_g1_i2:740-2077(+)
MAKNATDKTPNISKSFNTPKKIPPTSSPTKPPPSNAQPLKPAITKSYSDLSSQVYNMTNTDAEPPKSTITKSHSNLSAQTFNTSTTYDNPTQTKTKSIYDLSAKVPQAQPTKSFSTKRAVEEEEENEPKKPKVEPLKNSVTSSFSDKKDKSSLLPTTSSSSNPKLSSNPNTTIKKSDSFSLTLDEDNDKSSNSSNINNSNNSKSNSEEQKKKPAPKIFSPPKMSSPQPQKTNPPISQPIKQIKTGIHTLVFPLVSTTHNNFDTSKALAIAANSIGQFFQENHSPSIKLIMVISPTIFEQVFVELQKDFPDLTRSGSLRLLSADNVLTALDQIRDDKSQKVIAVETTWRLKEIPINKYIYSADSQLSVLTKKFYPNPGKLSEVYPIELANSSPLNTVHRIECLLWIIGPNLNPSKPDFIEDYNQGCDALKKTYENLFKRFCEFVQL